MKPLTCAATRRRLQAYHDGELPVDKQIGVAAHLEWCEPCADALEDLRAVGELLREGLPGRTASTAFSEEEAGVFPGVVVNRMTVEEGVSWRARLQLMFEDGHLVYAGAAAAVAALVCVVVMIAMMRFVNSTPHPDSIAALVDLLTPGSNQNPVVPRANVQMPKPLDAAFSAVPEMPGFGGPGGLWGPWVDDEAAFTLAGVVTREGRVANLKLVSDAEHEVVPGTDEAKAIANLLDAVSRARFEPASVAGLPVAVNMVWMVAHTTVRGRVRAPEPPVERPVRKRRIADVPVPAFTHVGA